MPVITGSQLIEMLEKLGTLAGVWFSATGPLVNVNVEKFPVPFLSVSSIRRRYVPSATRLPLTSVPFQEQVRVAWLDFVAPVMASTVLKGLPAAVVEASQVLRWVLRFCA